MMNENVLDVLMYLLENYISNDNDTEAFQSHTDIKTVLEEAGFEQSQIHKAFSWMKDVIEDQGESQNYHLANSKGFRAFAQYEFAKLGQRCCGFLIFLEQIGLLDPIAREIVIDHAMSTNSDEIDLDQLKWIVMMVISDQPNQNTFDWFQELSYTSKDQLH